VDKKFGVDVAYIIQKRYFGVEKGYRFTKKIKL
jgi:hypothetical protein